MDFPADYDTKMFPSARYLALARTFAIWAVILFLVIAGLSGALVWTMRASKAAPVLISISDNGATWTAIVGGGNNKLSRTADYAMQEALVGNFAKNWFRISSNAVENESNWCKCERDKCEVQIAGENKCAICCMSGGELYSDFVKVIETDYKARASAGEEWRLLPNTLSIAQISGTKGRGGLWRLTASVRTDAKTQKIEAFVRTAKADGEYPWALGYYISDFDAYPGD
jgi:hypothetical protein